MGLINAYLIDDNGFYMGLSFLQTNSKGDPYTKRNHLLESPPSAPEGLTQKYENGAWVLVDDPRKKPWYSIATGEVFNATDPAWDPGNAYIDFIYSKTFYKKSDKSELKIFDPNWTVDPAYTDIPPHDQYANWQVDIDIVTGEVIAEYWKVPRNVLEERAIGGLLAEFSVRMAAVKSGYSQEDIDSWEKQEREAREYIADPTNAITPLINGIALARGIPLADFAALVIQKADAYSELVGPLLGRKKVLLDEISLLSDSELENYNAEVRFNDLP